MCPWDRFDLQWLGLCSHNPIAEDIRCFSGEMDLTPEQLEEMARIRKEKNANYQHEYGLQLRAEASEEYRERQNRNNVKQLPGTQARQKAAVEGKK